MINDNEALTKFIESQFGKEIQPALKNQITNACTVKRIKKRAILFNEGDPGSHMFYMLKGVIKLFRTTEDGKEIVIHFVNAGEVFAEIVLRPATPYPVTAMALEPCTLVALDVRRFFDIMHSDRDFMQRFTALLTWRLKEFVNTIHNLTSQDVSGRLYSYLKNIAETKRTNSFQLPVAKKELALLLGTTPETLSRTIKKLTQDNLIKVNGQQVTVL